VRMNQGTVSMSVEDPTNTTSEDMISTKNTMMSTENSIKWIMGWDLMFKSSEHRVP